MECLNLYLFIHNSSQISLQLILDIILPGNLGKDFLEALEALHVYVVQGLVLGVSSLHQISHVVLGFQQEVGLTSHSQESLSGLRKKNSC